MRISALASALALTLSTTALSACGGGGKSPLTIAGQDLVITSSTLPAAFSGQVINEVIPLSGGCGGPYVMAVIQGTLPPGLSLDNATHSIKGVLLQASNFDFTLQITDAGCSPFSSTTQHYNWTVQNNPVPVIAKCDPAIIPIASYNPPNSVKFNDVDGLVTTVFGQNANFVFTVVGGTPPYTFEIVDDPADAQDSNWGAAAMPQGMSIPTSSTSFIGAPQQTGGATPFRITFRARDAANVSGFRKVQWKVDTPPIILATNTLPDGRCGAAYSQSIQLVDGVPPFEMELTTLLGNNATIVWQSPLAPIVNGGALPVDVVNGRATSHKVTAANYPATNVAGPYTLVIPEGLTFDEPNGTFTGIPRRVGNFTFNVHAFSTSVPNEYGQHVWKAYNPSFTDAVTGAFPYAFSSLSTWTVEGGAALLPGPTYSTLPEFERGVTYNPDGGVLGLEMKASGGVAKDGFNDAPHLSQRGASINGTGAPPTFEYQGGYDWTINWNPIGAGTGAPPGITFTTWTGILSVPNPALLVGQGRQVFGFSTTDQQLPTATTHTINGLAAFSVGPDKVIITESTTSYTGTAAGGGTNDHQIKLRVVEPLSSGFVFRDLVNATDLGPAVFGGGTALNPATTGTLNTLLTTLDLTRVSVNPTGWWDDSYGINPAGARAFQHTDQNRQYSYYSGVWQSGGSPLPWNPDVACVDLPDAPSVGPNLAAGIYNNGGRLYAFESSTRFGVFIIRPDSKIYVPLAFDKGTYQQFGDGMTGAYGANSASLTRIPQMTISPNGRFAAMKLKRTTSFSESAASSQIVLFSLTGEPVFGGSVFKIIDTGSLGGSTTGGIYQYAASLALTDNYLYYLCGNYQATYSSWHEHLIYRYTLTGGLSAGAPLSPNAFTEWVNNTGATANMMMTPFHKMDSPATTQTVTTFSQTAGGGFTSATVTLSVPNTEMYAYDGANLWEGGVAPVPFRVSKNGLACAILAGNEVNTTAGNVNTMNHHVWVDYNGTLRQLSTVRRHSPGGAGRGIALARGPSSYRHWGGYTGPTSRFEISDDATKVAVVVNRQSVAVTPTSTAMWYNYREDLVAFSTSNSWASSSEVFVTGDDAGGNRTFAGTHNWRFGALTFTADNAGLVFWGGYPSQNASLSTTYQMSHVMSGTFYSYSFGGGLNPAAGTLRSMLLTAGGGSDAGQTTYTTASPVNPTFVGNSGSQGRLRPIGGFLSKNRNFLYVMSIQAISTSEQATNNLVVLNIRSLNTAASINGLPDGNGQRLLGQPSRRGFVGEYYYFPYYGIEYRYYAPANNDGCGGQVMAKQSGYVFYGSHYQPNGPTQATSTTSSFGSSDLGMYWGSYGAYDGQIEGFNAETGGPVARITQTSFSQANSTVNRAIHHIECTPKGTALAFVYDTGGTSTNYGAESVGLVQKIAFDANTGALQAGKQEWASTLTGGRVSDAMAFDSTGNKLFVAFGSGDEANKQFRQVAFNPSSNTFALTSVGSLKRYNVLYAGR